MLLIPLGIAGAVASVAMVNWLVSANTSTKVPVDNTVEGCERKLTVVNQEKVDDLGPSVIILQTGALRGTVTHICDINCIKSSNNSIQHLRFRKYQATHQDTQSLVRELKSKLAHKK